MNNPPSQRINTATCRQTFWPRINKCNRSHFSTWRFRDAKTIKSIHFILRGAKKYAKSTCGRHLVSLVLPLSLCLSACLSPDALPFAVSPARPRPLPRHWILIKAGWNGKKMDLMISQCIQLKLNRRELLQSNVHIACASDDVMMPLCLCVHHHQNPYLFISLLHEVLS